MKKIKELLEVYGKVAIILHIVLFCLFFCVVFCLLEFGLSHYVTDIVEYFGGSTQANGGKLVIAYIATKFTQPIRIMILVVLLPWSKQRFSQYFPEEKQRDVEENG